MDLRDTPADTKCRYRLSFGKMQVIADFKKGDSQRALNMKAFTGADGREKMMEGVGNSEARNPLKKFHHEEKQREKQRLKGDMKSWRISLFLIE